MMHNTLGYFAIYNEKEYEFAKLRDGECAIYSEDAHEVEYGFYKVPNTENRYKKQVKLEELSLVFDKESVVIYKGEEFICSHINGNQVMLYTRSPKLAEKYQMNQRDCYEYWLYVDLKDIDEIQQVWKPMRKFNVKPSEE